MLGHMAEYVVSPVVIVRIDCAADASLAAIFDFNKFGIAIAAMINMIATTISNSISENPSCLRGLMRHLSFDSAGKPSIKTVHPRGQSTDLQPKESDFKCNNIRTLGRL